MFPISHSSLTIEVFLKMFPISRSSLTLTSLVSFQYFANRNISAINNIKAKITSLKLVVPRLVTCKQTQGDVCDIDNV
jgi:hypothetical protein